MKNKKRLIMMKGLPGSGKTTVAKSAFVGYKRINKDDLRDMLDNGVWSKKNEKFVLRARDCLIIESLLDGISVVVDDTNLSPKHEQRLKKLATDCAAEFEVYDLTGISVQQCIENDLKRNRSVGKDVIMSMYQKYIAPQQHSEMRLGEDNCIICDIDGTLATMKDRGPFEWGRVDTDDIVEHIQRIVNMHSDYEIPVILVSGRDESCRKKTEKWLEEKGVRYTELHMRKEGDMRKDFIIKKEIYDTHIKNNYNVLCVLDDRDQTVDMWRSIGLPCLQVNYGTF